MLLVSLAMAASCPWTAVPEKPDAPFLRVTFRAGRELLLRPAVDEQVALEVNVTEYGTTPSNAFPPLGLLLADGSEVAVPMKAARPPDLYGASTRHHLGGVLPAWDLSRLADIGVASLRFPMPGEPTPVLLTEAQREKVGRLLRCAVGEAPTR